MNEHVIVGDKFGDAFGAKISDAGSEGQQDVVSVLGKPECLLGHVSILTDLASIMTARMCGFTWSKNGSREYILSADRDEKIRISRYPNTYNIESYCDATVRVWEIAGPGGSKEVQKLEMMPVIEKYFGKEKLPNSDEVAVLKIRATRGKDGSSVPPLVAVLVEL
ncbi:WD repeat-containing protein 4 [Spiromyces aspiralis]|uniref:WD repeat-containing protein 4 n=1 Tax=Spiromyces aspiralis TaxID=68401 RepID=A0ACC1HNZ9_9FUNG|nr:WD repeat-containing protein 4 [Spiromyces aspiralis]